MKIVNKKKFIVRIIELLVIIATIILTVKAIAYACGYLKENEDVTRRQAVEIIRRILFEKI